jgi:D-lactate dehydrogenase
VIAEHVFALLLSTLRHITLGSERVRQGIFEYRGLRGMALRDKTLGVVGTGKIGKRVVEIAHGFGMRILASDVYQNAEIVEKYGVQYVERNVLLAESDIITLHAPALPETRHMIDAKAIGMMKDGVILVNTARGSLIDSTALLEGLKSGKVASALLDVLEHESSVAADKELVHHPHVVTTPHIAFYADDSVRTMYADCFESIAQWKRGEKPAHTVA